MKIHSGRYLIVALLFSTSFIACAPAGSSGDSSPPVFDGSDPAHRHWRWRHRDLGSVASPPSDLAEAPAPADLAGAPAPADMGETGPFSITAVDSASGPLGTVLTVSGSGLQSGDTVQISGSNLAAAALVTISLTSSSIDRRAAGRFGPGPVDGEGAGQTRKRRAAVGRPAVSSDERQRLLHRAERLQTRRPAPAVRPGPRSTTPRKR